ncbi:MAG TPA: type II toxin-antitoxin system RelE/ParE family toxin [Gammaproteobacteria bacterium]|nr:type II toxin-antitoxin system RelE/ParE family toxin [Gammaproteobacteria bacterium]
MRVTQTARFKRAVKKLHKKQKRDLDDAVREIMDDTSLGEMKVGDLAGVQVYKFKMIGQLTLLAYRVDDDIVTLTLLALGSHENFYRDLKR